MSGGETGVSSVALDGCSEVGMKRRGRLDSTHLVK